MKIQFTSVDLALAALAIIWALNFTVIKASLNEIDLYCFNAPQFSSVMITTGMISLTILAIPNIYNTNMNTVLYAAYGGATYSGALSIGLAYLAWNIGHIRIGTVQTAAYLNMITVPGMGFGIIHLNESLNLAQTIGTTAVVTGIILTSLKK